MKHRPWISLGIMLVCLFANCCNDASDKQSGTRCHATYVIDETSEICLFGQCDKYDSILREHYCPSNASLCIKDEKGRFFCGSICPEGKQENRSVEEFSSMCSCSKEQCLNANRNRGWIDADCDENDNCKALKCEDQYILHDDNCLNSIECCGNQCNPCNKSDGWESGSCKEGNCIADKCKTGYHPYPDDNGNVYCQIDTSDACGETGKACPPSYICNQEKAICECAPGLTECDDECHDLQTESDHCGSCDTICNVTNADNQCIAGECKFSCYDGYTNTEDNTSCIKNVTCPENTTYCDGICIDLSSDNHNCGTCGNECTASQCIDGTCQCADKKTECSGTCVDLSNDSDNCGTCGNKCESGLCKDNKCQCAENETDCDGTCVNLSDDPNNCGKCGYQCESNQCKDKKCQCNDNKTDCNGKCMDLSNDSNNCGACGNACPEGKNCNNNNCTCPSNETECNGICVDLTMNPNHCGSCDKVCESGNCVDSNCLCKDNQVQCKSDCISSFKIGVVIARPNLPCNNAPNNSENTIESYKNGQSVNIYAIENGWFVTLCNNQKAYIDSNYVFMMPTRGKISAANGIKLYKDYSTSEVITTLNIETQVMISDFKLIKDELWFKITEPEEGYTNESSFISRLEENGDDRDKLPNCAQ